MGSFLFLPFELFFFGVDGGLDIDVELLSCTSIDGVFGSKWENFWLP